MEIAVVGTDDFVAGFQLAGVRRIFMATEKDFDQSVEDAIKAEGVGIVVMDSDEMRWLSHKTRKALERLVTPVVVSLAAKGHGEDLRMLIKRTVGVDLWK